MSMTASLIAILLAAGPADAGAARCRALATPRAFTDEAAMRAIFCEYDAKHGGTLLPVKYTARWNVGAASELARPGLVARYSEAGRRKAVLVVNRAPLVDGEPVSTNSNHDTTVSVYVFAHDGNAWVFEKGKKAVVEGGIWGNAPRARLVRLGAERHGLLFEDGATHQGYTTSWADLVELSDAEVYAISPTLRMGESGPCESGAAADGDGDGDGDGEAARCETWDAELQLIAQAGQPYDLLRLSTGGKSGTCYERKARAYVPVEDPRCGAYRPRPDAEVFVAAEAPEAPGAAPASP